MILIIDNYDSFTFNLVQRLGELGAATLVRRNDQIDLAGIAALAPAAIVISPGPCTPDEAGVSVAAVQRFGPRIPILGVCLGHQAIGQAYGGRVVRARYPMHGKTAAVFHDRRAVYARLPRPFTAARYHSLVVVEAGLPSCLAVTARTADGEVMGLRHRSHPVEGVQFHPESILTPRGRQILKNFLRLVEGRRRYDA